MPSPLLQAQQDLRSVEQMTELYLHAAPRLSAEQCFIVLVFRNVLSFSAAQHSASATPIGTHFCGSCGELGEPSRSRSVRWETHVASNETGP